MDWLLFFFFFFKQVLITFYWNFFRCSFVQLGRRLLLRPLISWRWCISISTTWGMNWRVMRFARSLGEYEIWLRFSVNGETMGILTIIIAVRLNLGFMVLVFSYFHSVNHCYFNVSFQFWSWFTLILPVLIQCFPLLLQHFVWGYLDY